MADRVFNTARMGIMSGAHVFDTAGDNWGIILCMTGNNIDAASKVGTATVLTDLTMDEYDGSTGYTRAVITKTAVSLVTATDSTSVYVDFPNITFSSLASGSTSIAGILLYESNSASGNDSANIPIAYYDITDINGNGGNLEVAWAAPDAGALTLA